MLKQDLHIHTAYSANDSAIVPEQTVALVAAVHHAAVTGISDHFENLLDGKFEAYAREVRGAGLKVGTEVDGHAWVKDAVACNADYFIFHCRDNGADYRALDSLLATGRPLIIAHPNALDTNLDRVPPECIVEINNRYVWRTDWMRFYTPYKDRFNFILSSDAHQPYALGQAVARHAAERLGIDAYAVF